MRTMLLLGQIQLSTIFIFLLSCCNGALGRGQCHLMTSCSCRYDNGEYIDLSPLAGTGGIPRFLNVSDGRGVDTFSWNPCTWFTEGPCVNVSVCQMRHDDAGVEFFTIGWQQTADFAYKETTDEQLLSYNAITNDTDIRFAIITLTCVKNDTTTLEVFGQKSPTSPLYLFELKSPYACPLSPESTSEAPPTSTTSSSSVLHTVEIMVIVILGSVLVLIVLLVLVLLKVTGKICRRTTYERMK